MAKRKNKHIGGWLLGIILLLATVHFIMNTVLVSSEIPHALEFSRSRSSEGVPFSTYEKISDEAYRKALGVYAELDSQYIEKIGEVKPVLINERYHDVYGIHIGGSGITKQHVENRVPAVVISDTAAHSLNVDANVIGQTISLLGKDFTIVGIYHNPDGLLREMSSDIYERVYIPYTCYDDYPDTPIDTVTAIIGTHSEKSLALLGLTETNTDFYLRNDLGVKRDFLANLPRLFLSFITLILIVIALSMIIRIIRSTAHKLREDSRNAYGREVIRKNRKLLLLRTAAILFLIAVPTALLILFPPTIILPLNYIPPDNIFDVNHYLEALIKTLRSYHTNIWSGNFYLSNLFWSTSSVCIVEFILMAVGSLCFIKRIYFMINRRLNKETAVGSFEKRVE